MAVSAALCRAVSSVACSAARVAVRGRSTARLHSTVVCLSRPVLRPASELRRGSLRALPTFRLMATATDANLLRVIDAEIDCAVESGDHEQVDDIPKKFPFEIKDEPGTASIVLNRNFHGEKIEIIVSMPDMMDQLGEEDEEEDGDDHHGANEQQSQSSLPLIVKVSKDNGPILEFYCTAFPDEVEIDNLAVKGDGDSEDELVYEGPEFSDLDENLQKALHKYLEIRGISPATTNFLHEYMITKDNREYLVWMKKLKEFVQK